MIYKVAANEELLMNLLKDLQAYFKKDIEILCDVQKHIANNECFYVYCDDDLKTIEVIEDELLFNYYNIPFCKVKERA